MEEGEEEEEEKEEEEEEEEEEEKSQLRLIVDNGVDADAGTDIRTDLYRFNTSPLSQSGN